MYHHHHHPNNSADDGHTFAKFWNDNLVHFIIRILNRHRMASNSL